MLDLNAEIDKNKNFIISYSTPLILLVLCLIILLLSLVEIEGESLLKLLKDYFL